MCKFLYNTPVIVYFVRHGEGEHNANNLYSAPDFELTKKGIQEAKAVGERLKNLPIELLVVSTYLRTRQTAQIINKEIGEKPVIYSKLAVEIKRPFEIAGKSAQNPEYSAIRKSLDDNFNDPNFHYSDEENFFDLKNRGYKFLDYLAKLSKENIAVVSHSVFIRMLILLIISKDLTPNTFINSYKTMVLATSGLTVCEKNEKEWKLITWNDQSHLGD